MTNYWNSGDVEMLDDMLATTARVFDPVDITRGFALSERDIVEREYDLRVLDNPQRQLHTLMEKALLPRHPLSRSVIGSRESIRKITPAMAIAFKDIWYWGNNATLLVTGPVEAGDVIPLLRKHLSDIPANRIPPRIWKKPVRWDQRSVRAELHHSKVIEPFFHFHMRAPRPSGMSSSEAFRSVEVLEKLMDSSAAGSVGKALYYDRFVLATVYSHAWQDKNGTVNLTVGGTPEFGVGMETALAAVREHLARLSAFPASTFDEVHGQMLEAIERKKNDPDDEKNIALRGVLERGAPYGSGEYLQGIREVTPAHIDALLHAFNTNGISATGIAYPEDTE